VPNQEIKVLDIEDVKVKDYIDGFVLNRYVLQNPTSFKDFSRRSPEGFVGTKQWHISSKVECTFLRDNIGSDSGTIEGVYRGSSYDARNS